jgi:hypothetical protein
VRPPSSRFEHLVDVVGVLGMVVDRDVLAALLGPFAGDDVEDLDRMVRDVRERALAVLARLARETPVALTR